MRSPNELWEEISAHQVAAGTISVWWLYQAGLVLKSPGGTILAIDPYLSDAVNKSYHVARNVPAPLDPGTAKVDAVLASHSHPDHLDPDSIGSFASHPKTCFLGPPMATDMVVAAGVAADRTVPLGRGTTTMVGDVTVRAVKARHPFPPEPAPDAIGFTLECGGTSIYHSGDTEYDSEIVDDVKEPSAAFIVMNGTGGNMNVHEAALLAWRVGAKLAVPFHYGLWRDDGYGEGATLDPAVFVSTYERLSPGAPTLLLEAGRMVSISAGGLVDGRPEA